MATRLFLSGLLITCATAQNSKSTDDTLAINSALGPMDYIWLFYAIIALSSSLCCVVRCGLLHKWCKEDQFDALSEQAYTEIIQARGYDANSTAVGDKRCLSLMVLRADLKEKVIWHNDWKLDFLTYIRNEHALFSTCFGHPDHPFSRRDRRIILLSVIMMDFAFAMLVTWIFSLYPLSDTVEFIVDYLISYIFGFMMTILESILIAFAVCGAGERMPTCIRDMCKCCGTMVLAAAFCWGVVGFLLAVAFMIALSATENASVFWQVFALNFFLGLIQAWFLMDFIKMALQFRTAWKDAHPPEGEEKEEDIKKKKSCQWQCLKCSFFVFCFPVWLLWTCCCNNKKKKDPYDWGQDDYGITYEEYEAWKKNEDIGNRKLPHAYQAMAMPNVNRAMNEAGKKVQGKVDAATHGVQNTYDKSKENVKNEYKKGKEDLKNKGKMFGNKFKAKAMKMQMNLGNKKKTSNPTDDKEDVELVVDDGKQIR